MARFLTPKEAAEYLRVSVSSIYHWRLQGRLKGRKHGRLVLFEIEDLDNFDESQIPTNRQSQAFQQPRTLGIRDLRSNRARSLKSEYRQSSDPSKSVEDKDGL